MRRRAFCLGAAGVALAPAAQGRVTAAATGASRRPSLQTLWADFAHRFVTLDGRVVDTDNKGITHTEGLGVALLVAQACNDRARFDSLLTFSRQLARPDGLHSWKWAPGTGVIDLNNATDGDLYIAWALLRAGMRWRDSTLLRGSSSLVKSMREQLLVQPAQGSMLLPGKDGFIARNAFDAERVVVNPAYWVFPALRELQSVDHSADWVRLYKDALTVLERARFGPLGLPPDWLLLEDPTIPWQARPARFGYEAIRVPLFLAWERLLTHPTLKACAQHLREPGFPAWVSLLDQEKAAYTAPPGFEAVARLTRRGLYGLAFEAPVLDTSYFSSSLTLLTAMAAQDLGWA